MKRSEVQRIADQIVSSQPYSPNSYKARELLEKQAAAIAGIAPFLSASLDNLEDGHDGTYKAACNAIFDCDLEFGGGSDEF